MILMNSARRVSKSYFLHTASEQTCSKYSTIIEKKNIKRNPQNICWNFFSIVILCCKCTFFSFCCEQIYSLDDPECSELCFCTDTLALSCHTICVPLEPCRTALAFYSHASPAYQAFRGRCLCYSGNFICMRPQPGEYSLPGTV